MDEFTADTYAPRSPDLSGPVVDEPHPQHRQYRGSVSHISPYTPTEPKSPFSFSPPIQHQPPPPPPPPFQPQHDNPFYHKQAYNPFQNTSPPQPQRHMMKHEDEYQEDEEYQQESKQRPVSRSKKVKTEASEFGNGIPNNAPGVVEGIEVKTKFPVARIKRIMQADEDVGKVAQVTPVAVSKALELFMISLVTKAASEARARGSKRVTSANLKQAVQKEEQFDFLSEIVSKVPDAPAPRTKDEDSDEPMDGVGKKKRGAPRRKRKGSDEF